MEAGRILGSHLAKKKVFGGIHYPNPLFKAQPFEGATTIPSDVSDYCKYANDNLSLPMYPEMTGDHVRRIAESVRTFAGGSDCKCLN